METATTPDDLCIAITILKGHINYLKSKEDTLTDYFAKDLQRVLATVQEVDDKLRHAYIHAPTAAEAKTLRAIMYH